MTICTTRVFELGTGLGFELAELRGKSHLVRVRVRVGVGVRVGVEARDRARARLRAGMTVSGKG